MCCRECHLSIPQTLELHGRNLGFRPHKATTNDESQYFKQTLNVGHESSKNSKVAVLPEEIDSLTLGYRTDRTYADLMYISTHSCFTEVCTARKDLHQLIPPIFVMFVFAILLLVMSLASLGHAQGDIRRRAGHAGG
jgi:hypothetical protein